MHRAQGSQEDHLHSIFISSDGAQGCPQPTSALRPKLDLMVSVNIVKEVLKGFSSKLAIFSWMLRY